MSTLFESIVRPAADDKFYRPPKPVGLRAEPKIAGDNVVTWGNSGQSVFEATASISQSVKPAEWPEVSRTFDVVRILNPDDNTQHVDAEVMTEYNSVNAIDKSRFTLRFAPPQASDTTQILSRGNTRTAST